MFVQERPPQTLSALTAVMEHFLMGRFYLVNYTHSKWSFSYDTPGFLLQLCLHCILQMFLLKISRSRCESKNLNLLRPGTSSTDAECGKSLNNHIIWTLGTIVPVIVLSGLALFFHYGKKMKWFSCLGKIYLFKQQ